MAGDAHHAFGRLQALAESDGRYHLEAFGFVGESLHHASRMFIRGDGAGRHLTAQQLIEGALALAVERFGLLADLVLARWGVETSQDVGNITFALIEHGIFSKQPSDRIEDFELGPVFSTSLRARCQERLLGTAAS
jgi:uncharacterized repeat protein (TIGR04138 family)